MFPETLWHIRTNIIIPAALDTEDFLEWRTQPPFPPGGSSHWLPTTQSLLGSVWVQPKILIWTADIHIYVQKYGWVHVWLGNGHFLVFLWFLLKICRGGWYSWGGSFFGGVRPPQTNSLFIFDVIPFDRQEGQLGAFEESRRWRSTRCTSIPAGWQR